jgi:alpha-L-fucosidase
LHGNVDGTIMIKGLSNKIEEITVVGNGSNLKHKVVGKTSWSHVPGLVYIDVPQSVKDKYVTVLRLKLDKPVKLYRGQGGFN